MVAGLAGAALGLRMMTWLARSAWRLGMMTFAVGPGAAMLVILRAVAPRFTLGPHAMPGPLRSCAWSAHGMMEAKGTVKFTLAALPLRAEALGLMAHGPAMIEAVSTFVALGTVELLVTFGTLTLVPAVVMTTLVMIFVMVMAALTLCPPEMPLGTKAVMMAAFTSLPAAVMMEALRAAKVPALAKPGMTFMSAEVVTLGSKAFTALAMMVETLRAAKVPTLAEARVTFMPAEMVTLGAKAFATLTMMVEALRTAEMSALAEARVTFMSAKMMLAGAEFLPGLSMTMVAATSAVVVLAVMLPMVLAMMMVAMAAVSVASFMLALWCGTGPWLARVAFVAETAVHARAMLAVWAALWSRAVMRPHVFMPMLAGLRSWWRRRGSRRFRSRRCGWLGSFRRWCGRWRGGGLASNRGRAERDESEQNRQGAVFGVHESWLERAREGKAPREPGGDLHFGDTTVFVRSLSLA